MNRINPEQRYEQGREAFASMIRSWLAISGISYSKLRALGTWAMGTSWISTSQLTKTMNDRSYSPHFKYLDALAACNAAIRVWKEDGPEAARRIYGPLHRPLTADLLDGCVWLADPDDPGRPLDFLDLCAIFTGKQPAPTLAPPPIAADHAARLSDAIGRRLDAWLAQRGGLRAGFQELLQHYDVDDRDRIERLRDVIVGSLVLTVDELEHELPSLIWLFSGIEHRQLNRRELLELLDPPASSQTTAHHDALPEKPTGRQRTHQRM